MAPIFGAIVSLFGIALVLRRSSPVGAAVATVAIGYVLGYPFWHARLGPVPLTVDRILLGVMLVVVAVWFLRGRIALPKLLAVDWIAIALLGWLTVSCLAFGIGPDTDLPTSPMFRLLFSFWAPALLYLVVRLAPLTTRTVTVVLAVLTGLGAYLAFTACAEVAAQWWAVFPKYISDPELGTHFGRARGPALNSVSLGNYLSVAFWAAWTLRSRVSRGWQLLIFSAMALMVAAVFFTYTRSVWLGLALSALVIVFTETPKRYRWHAAAGVLAAAVVAAVMAWSFVMHLDREDSGRASRHSVQQRTAFAYVSWNMFFDEPLTGVGFGRFYDKKLPYLSDRSQSFELESIRELHHHNTFLGLLTETGILGLVAYAAMLVVWCQIGLRMSLYEGATLATQQMGRWMLAVLAVYLPSALFHDLSHIYQDQWLVFLVIGMAVATAEQAATKSCTYYRAPSALLRTTSGTQIANAPRRVSSSSTARKVALFGMEIDRVTLSEATAKVLAWCNHPTTSVCRYVVTPNVDHAVLLTHHSRLRKSYASADMVLADGAPIVAASKLLGHPLPERVAGSDLVPNLLSAAEHNQRPLRVFLLGAGPGVAKRATENIHRRYTGVEVVGTHCPPVGFERNPVANQVIFDAVAAARPDVVVIGLGAPKQELWIAKHQYRLEAKVAICAGATIDFLAGEKRRAPVWMQRAGLEWLYRLSTEPRRLAGRYFRDAVAFPRLVWSEWQRVAG